MIEERNWANTSAEDFRTIHAICERAVNEGMEVARNDRLALSMDIEAFHMLQPLNLAELLVSERAQFGHDIAGIWDHYDRTRHEITGHFVARHARPETANGEQTYTVSAMYNRYYFNRATVKADSVEEACRKALESTQLDDGWDDCDDVGDTYITAVHAGEVEFPEGEGMPFPEEYTERAQFKDPKARHFVFYRVSIKGEDQVDQDLHESLTDAVDDLEQQREHVRRAPESTDFAPEDYGLNQLTLAEVAIEPVDLSEHGHG